MDSKSHSPQAYRQRGIIENLPQAETYRLKSTVAKAAKIVVAVASVAAISFGFLKLNSADEGLSITTSKVAETPITIFKPKEGPPSPVIVIAHGFAGSQQLMQPFAETFARNGYTAVTFDFLGHGRNPVPMSGDITEGSAITAELLGELGQVTDYARKLGLGDGRVGVLGHSMASDIVVRYAQAHPDVEATVAVSIFSPVATANSPRNLLVIVGTAEPDMLIDEARRIVNLTAGGNVIERQTYGQFSNGTARRLVLARGVEHIGVLYSSDSMNESLAWINAAFGRTSHGDIDRRGIWLAMMFAGIVALAWPLSRLLPVVTDTREGNRIGWKFLVLLAFLPAAATPLILWKMPTDFLPILLGDYLALHFALYGVLTFTLLVLLRRDARIGAKASTQSVSWSKIALAAALAAAYDIIAFGVPLDSYVFSFLPIPSRVPIMAIILCGTLPFFITDEWLTRGIGAKRGSYALTKFAFLLSLALAILLNPQKLFFLAIIVPAILLLFLAFGLISGWIYQRTRHPVPGAIANAVLFAWAISVTFPMVTR